MHRTILASAAALAVALSPSAFAQTTMSQNNRTMTAAEQRSAYDTWPPERQQMYDAWEPGIQSYFWTLTPQQQTGWWLLTDDQRTQVYAMTPQQREQAWVGITAQLSGAQSTPMARSNTTGYARINYVSNAIVQPIAADQAAVNGGTIPICGPNEYDNCINAWEAGRRGPNVTEPLEYWPGEPADPRRGE